MQPVYRNSSTVRSGDGYATDTTAFRAANRQFVNDTLSLGVDCAQVNAKEGRPSVGVGFGSVACHTPSISSGSAAAPPSSSHTTNHHHHHQQQQQQQTRPSTSTASAAQMVMAQSDIRYAPSRFADQNSHILSGGGGGGRGAAAAHHAPHHQLMGTRELHHGIVPGGGGGAAAGGCTSSGGGQTFGNTSTCAVGMNVAAGGKPRSHTDYWSPIVDTTMPSASRHHQQQLQQQHHCSVEPTNGDTGAATIAECGVEAGFPAASSVAAGRRNQRFTAARRAAAAAPAPTNHVMRRRRRRRNAK